MNLSPALSLCMDTAEIVESIIFFEFSCSVRQLQSTVVSRRAVHRTWRKPVFKAAARWLFLAPYDLELVSVNLRYVPPKARVDRLVRAAENDLRFMDLEEFKQIVTAQLLLQHMRVHKPYPHRITIREMLDVFVGSVDARLSCTHPFIQEAVLATLDLGMPYSQFMRINIHKDIAFMHRYYRQLLPEHDCFCLMTLVHTLQGFSFVWRVVTQAFA